MTFGSGFSKVRIWVGIEDTANFKGTMKKNLQNKTLYFSDHIQRDLTDPIDLNVNTIGIRRNGQELKRVTPEALVSN